MKNKRSLTLGPISFRLARQFIAQFHTHHPPPVGWKWGHGVYDGYELMGVAIVGRPVARMISDRTTVEVTRLCVRRDIRAPNACSMLYAAAAREARRQGYDHIISYVLEGESGVSLKAAGWQREHLTPGGSWSRAYRTRTDKHPRGRKWRWGKHLRPLRWRPVNRPEPPPNQQGLPL